MGNWRTPQTLIRFTVNPSINLPNGDPPLSAFVEEPLRRDKPRPSPPGLSRRAPGGEPLTHSSSGLKMEEIFLDTQIFSHVVRSSSGAASLAMRACGRCFGGLVIYACCARGRAHSGGTSLRRGKAGRGHRSAMVPSIISLAIAVRIAAQRYLRLRAGELPSPPPGPNIGT